MSKIINKVVGTVVNKIVSSTSGFGLEQELFTAEGPEAETDPETLRLARQAVAEGCVLLKNTGILPLEKEKEISVFGRCQLDWFYVGHGSGGNVHPPHKVSFMEGLKNAGASYNQKLADIYKSWTGEKKNAADNGWWGHWASNYTEMPVTDDLLSDIANPEIAVIVIGRTAGEDSDNELVKGCYYLTDTEEQMIDMVCRHFRKTIILLNIGNIIDMSWTLKYRDRIDALMIVWQGGMESGNGLCDVLYGVQGASGRLPDTIAGEYMDYPSSADFGGAEYNEYKEDIFVGYRYFEKKAADKILYPFGYGLSYTVFLIETVDVCMPDLPEGTLQSTDRISIRLKVSNTGKYAGRDVLQLWCMQPDGKLEKAAKILTAFAKTEELQPGESCQLTLSTDIRMISSYDETISAFILEKGDYQFFVTDNNDQEFIKNLTALHTEILHLDHDILIEQCETACVPKVDLKKRILERLPEDVPFKGDQGYTIQDVINGKHTLREFTEQFSNEDLETLTRGQGMMNSPLGTSGNAGVFGGFVPLMMDKGVRPVVTSDGPAGLRLKKYCSLMPCGTMLAASFDTSLVHKLYECVGREMTDMNIDVLLGPGMNIHRNHLCGRNFEYFSEDPLLSGKMGAAVVRAVQSTGKAACIKHFACNNQEYKRNTNDSRVSERALREIYLRNFEICVREAGPKVLMTSYNKINGVWAHYNYDLVTTILRKQWGFSGTVITDWWMQHSESPEFPGMKDNAYRVRAQVDVLMPGDFGHLAKKYVSDGTLLATMGKENGITRAELIRTAENVLRLVMYLQKN